MTTMLYLARHAEQELTAKNNPAAGISALGQDQARLLGKRLRAVKFDAIQHSPAARARETAYVVAQTMPDVPVRSSELLRDLTPVPELAEMRDYSEAELTWLAHVPAEECDPGGAEISSAIKHFSSLGASRQLLITHAFVISWFVRAALDAPPRRWLGLNPFNAGLTVIRYRPDHPDQPVTLIAYNDVGHLPLEFRGRTPVDLDS
jgi:serine/threonine-protein phosphatase PGAM5